MTIGSNLSSAAHEFLAVGGKRVDVVESPVEQDGGATYMRYDEIRIRSAEPGKEGVFVEYYWRGVMLSWMHAKDVKLASDSAMLNLNGMEGRFRLTMDQKART